MLSGPVLSNTNKVAKALKVPLTQLLDLNDNAIINSFNNLQQDATSMAYSHFHADTDREHTKALLERISFLEKLVSDLVAKLEV